MTEYWSIAIKSNNAFCIFLYIGKEDYKTPEYLCASSFFKAVMKSKSKVASLKDIYLVLDDEDIEQTYLEPFRYTSKITPRAESKVKNSKSIKSSGKMLSSLPKNEDNCCIAWMSWQILNDWKSVGIYYIFCKVCIEQSIQYKPACLSCGQIYGKMTDYQPPGSIMNQNDYQQKLKGFSDSTGCIILASRGKFCFTLGFFL